MKRFPIILDLEPSPGPIDDNFTKRVIISRLILDEDD